MKKFISTVVSVLYSVSVLAGIASLVPQRVVAQDGDSNAAVAAAENQSTKPAAAATYKYVAQSGDSYTQMARKAIQTYGIKNKVKLSYAKIIAAETWATQEAGSPYLDLGQAVEIKDSTVKANVEKAQKLTAAEEAAWDVYSATVDFNTNAVGQAR